MHGKHGTFISWEKERSLICKGFSGLLKSFDFISSSNTRQQTSKRQGGRTEVPVLDHVLSLIQLPENEDITDLSQPWVALVVLPHIR